MKTRPIKAGESLQPGDEQLVPGSSKWEPVPDCVIDFDIPANDPSLPYHTRYRRPIPETKK